jgi:purine nucleoside phosphorylase
MNEFDKAMEAVRYINNASSIKPEIGIILGTGLDKLAEKIKKKQLFLRRDTSFPCFNRKVAYRQPCAW